MTSISIQFDESVLKAVDNLPAFVRYKVIDKALADVARPIKRRAMKLAPSSRATGSRKKWSDKYKKNAKYQNDSGKEITHRVKKTDYGAEMTIGASAPKGNKQRFNHPTKKGSRRVMYWGKDTGKTWPMPTENYIQKASNETQSEQRAALNDRLEYELANYMEKQSRG